MEHRELKEQLQFLQQNIEEACAKVELSKLISELAALEAEMALPEFWEDQAHAQEVVQEMKNVKELVDTWSVLKNNIEGLTEMAEEVESEDFDTLAEELSEVHQAYEAASITLYFRGRHDHEPALLTVTSGAGGDDAEDFAGMLFRMYAMFAEKHGFTVSVHEYMDGAGSSGIKKATMELQGKYSYGMMKWEKGVHRLVRLSPFKSNDSRQKSFSHVEVMPFVKNISKDDIEIKPEDLRMDTFRASGSGGQKVNKTDSAVRLTHLPTGIAVSCQSERSQHTNRDKAMEILQAKLFQLKMEEEAKARKELKGDAISVDWGKQIRSYVLHPYKMIKDHRTNYETSHVEKTLDGELLPFIESAIKELST